MTTTDLTEGIYELDHAGTLALTYLKTRINELQGVNRDRFTEILQQSKDAGNSFSIREQLSQRRYEIGRGLLLLAESGQLDNDLVTGICEHVTGKQYDNGGQGLANLSAQDAARFASICAGIMCGSFDVTYISTSNKFLINEGTTA